MNNEYVLKEGSLNCIELTLQVHNDIVYGLKFAMFVKKMGVNVSKDEEVIGSFSPTIKPHVV